MEDYQKLRVISYDQPTAYLEVGEARRNSISAVHTGLNIQPFDPKKQILLNEKFELFFVILQQTSLLKDKLNDNSRQINQLMNRLPEVGKDNIFYHLLIDEIQASNDIEGVRSTKKEIREAISIILEKSTTQKRFKSLVYQYMNFQKSEFSEIQQVKDIREIYDQLLVEELDDEDRLKEGELFRTEPVFIVEQTSGKQVHKGVDGQEHIIENIERLVSFMNRSDIPSFEKAFVSHFYFENTHPFYDGNGRCGRFILCSYLARKLDYLSAVGLSSAILKHKAKYYKAFQEVSHPRNLGEVTFFVLDMFELVLKAQAMVLKELQQVDRALLKISKEIRAKTESSDEHLVLYSLAQDRFYDNLTQPTDEQIAMILGVSRQKLKQITVKLRNKGLIKQVKQKPSVHQLSESFWLEIYR